MSINASGLGADKDRAARGVDSWRMPHDRHVLPRRRGGFFPEEKLCVT